VIWPVESDHSRASRWSRAARLAPELEASSEAAVAVKLPLDGIRCGPLDTFVQATARCDRVCPPLISPREIHFMACFRHAAIRNVCLCYCDRVK
jgi:hypothetical protein